MRSLGLLVLLAGCAARRSGDAIASIDFVGNDGEPGLVNWIEGKTSDHVLRNAMSHPQPRWQSFFVPGIIEPDWVDRRVLDTDAWRIEVWYANHGYFDARFLGWEISSDRPKKKRRKIHPVHVRGFVDEGEPSKVRTLALTGLDSLPPTLQRELGKEVELSTDTIFETEAYDDSLDAIRATLLDQSYAFMKVDGDVAVHPDEHAVDVGIRVDPGPPSRFGPVTFVGLERAPEAIVRDALDIEEGEPYRARAIETSRSKLYALRVFGVVNVIPDLSHPESAVVPVRIEVKETKSRELQAGPAFLAETGQISLAVHAAYEDDNVANRLWRFEQDVTAGAAMRADSVWEALGSSASDIKPLVDLKGTVELPHVMGPDWSLVNQGRFEVGLEPTYTFYSPSVSPSMLYKGLKHYRINGGFSIKYRKHIEEFEIAKGTSNDADVNLPDNYLLSYLFQRVVYDGRNDPFEPTKGAYWSLDFAESGTPVSNFDFLRGAAEIRGYRSIDRIGEIDPGLVFAGRVGTGVAYPLGDGERAVIPDDLRFFLGGATTVRGWAADTLGPFACVVGDTAEGLETRLPRGRSTAASPPCGRFFNKTSPVGGNLEAFGNLEVRKSLFWGISAAGFVDVGRVWADPNDFTFAGLQWSVGGGLRLATPIGPIRADIGFRLTPHEFPYQQTPYAFHLALGEAF